MTALNLAHELLEKRHAVDSVQEEADVMVKRLTERITEALAEHKQLGF
jgi:cell division protein ZapA (FtsZ GTPase activity inhibitor)